jgi:hypothetical protein
MALCMALCHTLLQHCLLSPLPACSLSAQCIRVPVELVGQLPKVRPLPSSDSTCAVCPCGHTLVQGLQPAIYVHSWCDRTLPWLLNPVCRAVPVLLPCCPPVGPASESLSFLGACFRHTPPGWPSCHPEIVPSLLSFQWAGSGIICPFVSSCWFLCALFSCPGAVVDLKHQEVPGWTRWVRR